MKLKQSKDWYKAKIEKESNLEIGAGFPPISVEVGGKYFSKSLNKEITITKEENSWFISDDYVSWSKQGRRFSDTTIDLQPITPKPQKNKSLTKQTKK